MTTTTDPIYPNIQKINKKMVQPTQQPRQNTRFIRYREETFFPEIVVNRSQLDDMSDSNYIEVPIQDVYYLMVYFIITDDDPIIMKLVNDEEEFMTLCRNYLENVNNEIRDSAIDDGIEVPQPLVGSFTREQFNSLVFRIAENNVSFGLHNRFLFRLTV